MTDSVLTKLEALRLATLIMTKNAMVGKGDKTPSPQEILQEAKKLHEWMKD